jgi:hypothetical protein
MTLNWIHHSDHKHLLAISESQINGTFRIFYDDVMYWPSWSPDCTQDLDSLKKEAQEIHDQWIKLSTLSS